MGTEFSQQFRLTDTCNKVPIASNKSLRNPAKICRSLQSSKQALPRKEVDPIHCTAQIDDKIITVQESPRISEDQRTAMLPFLEAKHHEVESELEKLATEQQQADKDELQSDLHENSTSGKYEGEYEKKLKSIQETLRSLDESLHETRGLETENSLRYSQLKTRNMSLRIDLDKANKRNKNMLNLFRQNAAGIGFDRLRTCGTLPESLRKDVQHIWSQKYDALLKHNNQLRKEAADADFVLKEKDRLIGDLQQRLLNLAEDLIQREKTIAEISTKFLSLKQRKDDQEILLRGSVETLQVALQKAKSTVTPSKSESRMMPSKNALIAREIRRSDRLAYENSLLRDLLQEAKRSCRSSRTSSTISLCNKNV